MKSASDSIGTVINVQILRAVAALLVVWVHAQAIIPSAALPNWASTVGYGGVDLFFVISGFIMVRTTDHGNISPLTFFRKRCRRVVPLYYVFTLLVVAISLIMPAALKSTRPDLVHVIEFGSLHTVRKEPRTNIPSLLSGLDA